MVIDAAFKTVLVASLTGLILSVFLERLVLPRPLLKRPWAAWMLHVGLWLFAYVLLTLLVGRPWFAAAGVSAFLLMLVMVNNAKMKALREPFVFQDYEYFTDAIKHPRLYIPFLGWWKFLGVATGFVSAIVVGLLGEQAPAQQFVWNGQMGGVVFLFALAALFMFAGNRQCLSVSFNPEQDLRALGLLASFWRYREEEISPLVVDSPFNVILTKEPEGGLPDLVAVQSESFFDPRSLVPFIRPQVLAEFDLLKDASLAYGKLNVPAWGANTVRSEFAFLTGIGDDQLGVHRFNPYRAIAAGCDVPSLVSYLKQLGYRTVCIHPYPADFYRRDRVFPRLGFDEFLDIREFSDSIRCGPYIADSAVADRIVAILRESTSPVFIFAITMENHGPLHLEKVAPSDIREFYSTMPEEGCDDLTIYLRHLRNADRMIAHLRKTLEEHDRPNSLCWFGDHVPIMPVVYKKFGEPSGRVDYVCWSNRNKTSSRNKNLAVKDLAVSWLSDIGLIRGQ